MRILITGGAGFIGSGLVEYYLQKDNIVHVIDDLSTGREENIKPFLTHPNFNFTKADLLTCKDLEKIVLSVDFILHFAAVVGVLQVLKSPERILDVNIKATERLLQIVKNTKTKPKLILASTSEVYGDAELDSSSEINNLRISDVSLTRTTYTVSKIAMESYGIAYYKQFNLPIIILRIFNVIGPRQSGRYGMVVPRFIKRAVLNKPIVVYGTGEQKRSFIDIRDAVCLISQIAENPESIGQIINLGKNIEISINSLAKLVRKLAKSNSTIEHISYEEAYNEDFSDFMHRKPDLTKLQQLTTYKYQWDLDKTINNLIYLTYKNK